ncbi:MAG TPA: SDR family oxidoreductase [Spirochaetota bacterium]|nr:SDR family oxidoreductase [Spirochaetota bacterium]
MNVDLKDRVALVTGASRGIGRSISIALASHGARVVLSSRSEKGLQEVKREIGEAAVIPADLSKKEDIDSLFSSVSEEFGRLDILVNNAGIGYFGKLADFSIEDFDRIMAVNLRGTYLCCQQAMRLMIPKRKGHIINMSSVVGFKGYQNQSAYTASKHGLMGLTKSLAVEAQEYGIRVSVICPGVVDTDFGKVARPDLDDSVLIPPEDIANTVLYLLSLSDRSMVDEIYIRRSASTPF